jgi:membrane protein implicated in regulation of membrane protease activity
MFILTLSPTLLWLSAALFLLVIELGTPGLFVFICFALGATFGAILSALDFSFMIQCYGALAFSLFQFMTMRRRLLAFTRARHEPTNIDGLVGREGVAVRQITPANHGHVKIGGEEWAAQCVDGSTIKAQARVRVVRVVGNKVMVKAITTKGGARSKQGEPPSQK